jgi:hypothetical protein
MLVAIGDSLSDLASSDDEEDGQDEDYDETEEGKLGKDDEPGWLIATITQMLQQLLERFRHMEIKLDELSQRGWVDAVTYFLE